MQIRPKPFMVSLSNHEPLERASFDKLRMSGWQWIALFCNRPGVELHFVGYETESAFGRAVADSHCAGVEGAFQGFKYVDVQVSDLHDLETTPFGTTAICLTRIFPSSSTDEFSIGMWVTSVVFA